MFRSHSERVLCILYRQCILAMICLNTQFIFSNTLLGLNNLLNPIILAFVKAFLFSPEMILSYISHFHNSLRRGWSSLLLICAVSCLLSLSALQSAADKVFPLSDSLAHS